MYMYITSVTITTIISTTTTTTTTTTITTITITITITIAITMLIYMSSCSSIIISLRRRLHTCHILPPSEIDLGLFWANFTDFEGKHLFHRIG